MEANPEATHGKSPAQKNIAKVADFQVSTHSVDRYNLELRFKPKHRNAINLAKDTATFKRFDEQTNTKYGFIPLGDLLCPEQDARNSCTCDMLEIYN